MRDDFTLPTVQLLAKRVGFRCSNPDCRKPTSGPAADEAAVNLGVAAHITAASPGGARYDDDLPSEERRAAANGVWLCQQCSRLVDADDSGHSVALLKDWKTFAEAAAAVELRGFSVRRGRDFATLEAKMPDLIASMREDLTAAPLVREFVLLTKRQSYNPGRTPFFFYRFEEHEGLLGKLRICEHYGAVYNIRREGAPKYNFTEDFVDYLLG